MSIGLGPYLRLVSLGIVSHACPACDEIHRIALGAGQDWDHAMAGRVVQLPVYPLRLP